jgi:hypothetical protein
MEEFMRTFAIALLTGAAALMLVAAPTPDTAQAAEASSKGYINGNGGNGIVAPGNKSQTATKTADGKNKKK